MSSGPTAATVRSNIARFRKGAELSFAELARRLEARGHSIPPLGLRRIEAGERRVDVDDLVALALALDVSPNALLFPPTYGSTDVCEITGYVLTQQLTSDRAWMWGRGQMSLSEKPRTYTAKDREGNDQVVVDTRAFRERVSPRRIRTDDDRAHERAQWARFEIYRLEEELERDRLIARAEGQEITWDPRMDELEELRSLDPSDDAAWAARGFDPAPPENED